MEEKQETYELKLKCKNCMHKDTFNIPKGQSWKDYVKENKCPKCGNLRLKKAIIQFI